MATNGSKTLALKKFNMSCAADEERGIGKDGHIPWKLPREFAHFCRLATFRADKTKLNAAILGRPSNWTLREAIDQSALYIIVVSKTLNEPKGFAHCVCRSVADAVQLVSSTPLADKIENVWIWGGGGVYKEALDMEQCHRVYLTRIYAQFGCDAFFPEIDMNKYKLARDPDISGSIQEEKGIKYKFEVYERSSQPAEEFPAVHHHCDVVTAANIGY